MQQINLSFSPQKSSALRRGTTCAGTQPRCVFFFGYFVHHQLSHRTSAFNRIIPNHSAKSPLRREKYKEEDQRQDTGRMKQRTKRGSRKPNHGEICTSPLFCDGKEKNFPNLMSPSTLPAVKSGLTLPSLMRLFSASTSRAHAGKAARQGQQVVAFYYNLGK